MRAFLFSSLLAFEALVFAYFFVLNTFYLISTVVSFFELRRQRRRWTTRDLDAVMRSPATPAISLVVPVFNEAGTIGESVRALLMLNYPQYEVIVVNDGSTDATLAVASEIFELMPADVASEQPVATAGVRGIYRSLTYPELTLVDKANGGKADAMNAGVNVASHPLVCVIDGDSLLDAQALTRVVLPYLEDPRTVAVGGIIRIVNGCEVEHGRVVGVGLPRSAVARFQVAEYLRAFLAGRVAQSAAGSLLIVSGAFGLFRRDTLLAIGGFDTATIGEDMEAIVRLHRWCRDRGEPYRIVFRPDAVCWTEAPEQLSSLAGQRKRWQRGTCQVLRKHYRALFNPRYGVIGMLALPYYLLFEALGPLLEAAGYVVTVAAVGFGVLDWRYAELLFLVAVAYGALITLAAVVLEELTMQRAPRAGDLLTLAVFGVLENFGYRQLTTWWRLRGIIDWARGRGTWGAMPRRGFQRPAASGGSS